MGAPALPSRGQSADIEVEWQFDALDLRPVERWLARLAVGAESGTDAPGTLENPGWRSVAAAPVSIVDRYLDTEDWRIGQAGYVLRLRHKARGDEVTLKGLSDSAPADGLRRRVEITEKTEPGVEWLNLEGPVGSRVSAMIGRRPLRHVLEVRTERRPFAIWIGENPVAELAMDETLIAAYNDEQPARLCRVEVEVVGEWSDVLTPLVEDLRSSSGLWPARLSKFEAGMLAHGMSLPGRPDLGPTEVTPTSSFGELADAVIRRHLSTLIANEPGTRLGEDPEDLHDMRVATRRLRAAISFFKDILPTQFSVLRLELSWLASVLGAVRDLDVHLEGLEGAEDHLLPLPEGTDPPLDHLRAVLTAERQVARGLLLRALDSPRYERLTTGLASLAQQGAARRIAEYHVPAVVVVPGLVGTRYRSTSRAARQARRAGQSADFHRLRIRGKKLRYAVEFASDLYGEPAQQFARKLAKLQDALGSVQDATVAIERLLQLAADADHPLPPITVFVMGAMAERHRGEAAELMTRIPGRLTQLNEREWQDLALLMEARRVAAVREQAAISADLATAAPSEARPSPGPEPAVSPFAPPEPAARADVPATGAAPQTEEAPTAFPPPSAPQPRPPEPAGLPWAVVERAVFEPETAEQGIARPGLVDQPSDPQPPPPGAVPATSPPPNAAEPRPSEPVGQPWAVVERAVVEPETADQGLARPGPVDPPTDPQPPPPGAVPTSNGHGHHDPARPAGPIHD
jgi:triphosphatase